MAQARNTAARTNREGGVKSLGRPSIPSLSEALEFHSPQLDGDIAGVEGNVVAQICDVPIKARRVGHHTKRVVVDFSLPSIGSITIQPPASSYTT